MASKALILLGLFALLFIVSEVAAASEKQSGSVKLESEETVQPNGNPNGGGYNGGPRPRERGYCRHGCCFNPYGSCRRCCSYAGEAVQIQPGH